MFLIETICRKKRVIQLILNFDIFLFGIKIKQQRIEAFSVHMLTAFQWLVWTAFFIFNQAEVIL
nr:MAG TPA: hypothetical protein [Caudoviricetes sp.]